MELVAASVARVHYSGSLSRTLMCQYDECVTEADNPFSEPSGYNADTCPMDPFHLPSEN